MRAEPPICAVGLKVMGDPAGIRNWQICAGMTVAIWVWRLAGQLPHTQRVVFLVRGLAARGAPGSWLWPGRPVTWRSGQGILRGPCNLNGR